MYNRSIQVGNDLLNKSRKKSLPFVEKQVLLYNGSTCNWIAIDLISFLTSKIVMVCFQSSLGSCVKILVYHINHQKEVKSASRAKELKNYLPQRKSNCLETTLLAWLLWTNPTLTQKTISTPPLKMTCPVCIWAPDHAFSIIIESIIQTRQLRLSLSQVFNMASFWY